MEIDGISFVLDRHVTFNHDLHLVSAGDDSGFINCDKYLDLCVFGYFDAKFVNPLAQEKNLHVNYHACYRNWNNTLQSIFCRASLKSRIVSQTDSEIFYRSLQLLHGEVTSFTEIVAPGCQILAIFMLIAVPFSLIEFGSFLDKYTKTLLMIIGLATLCIFYVITIFCARIYECSIEFPKTHRQILGSSFLRSCQPLRWKMGSRYYIGRNSFLTLLKNFVIKILVKLVLTV